MPLACGPYDQLAATILEKFQESPTTVGNNDATACVLMVGKGLFSESVGQVS
jgi:hypothetical protein